MMVHVVTRAKILTRGLQVLFTHIILLHSFNAHAEEFCLPLDAQRIVRGTVESPIESDLFALALIIPGTHTKTRDGSTGAPGENSGDGIYLRLALELRKQGVTTARFDPPEMGSCESEFPWERKNEIEDSSLSTESNAILKIANYLQKRRRRNEKIVWIGHSQGGIVGAELLSANPSLASGFFTYGITLRPMRDATIFQYANIRVEAMRSLIYKTGKDCISNNEISSNENLSKLQGFSSSIDNWLSPTGNWCLSDLSTLKKRFIDQLPKLLNVADSCENNTVASGTSNSCEELQLFTSQKSIPGFLENFRGIVDVMIGSNDPNLKIEQEMESFDQFKKKFKTKRHFEIIDGAGHMFGNHPYMGPVNEKYVETFARLVANKIGVRE